MIRSAFKIIAASLLCVFTGPMVEASERAEEIDVAPLRIFTHGQGDFARGLGAGGFEGRGIDLLHCAMGQLHQPYVVSQAAMARKSRLEQSGSMDAWLPSIVYGAKARVARIAAPIGEMRLYWYVPKASKMSPANETFRKTARVSAFPGSTPARILKSEGFAQVRHGSDDENSIILWLIEGRLDGFLSASFDGLLMPGARALRDAHIDRTLYKAFDVGIEFMPMFMAQKPAFVESFRTALAGCQ